MDIVEELRKNRDSGARRLVSEYKAGLMSLARNFCQDESDAEELVNATFAKVVANIDSYLEQSAFFAWMCQILTNLFRESVRRKSNKNEFFPGDVPDIADDGAQATIYASLDHSLVRDAIGTLTDDEREILLLHYFLDMPVGKMAKILAVPCGTVKSRLHYARVALAAKLGAARCAPAVQTACAPDVQTSYPLYGYDLINEPWQHRRARHDYWTLQRRAAEATREIDPAAPIIVEANQMAALDAVPLERAELTPTPSSPQGASAAPWKSGGPDWGTTSRRRPRLRFSTTPWMSRRRLPGTRAGRTTSRPTRSTST